MKNIIYVALFWTVAFFATVSNAATDVTTREIVMSQNGYGDLSIITVLTVCSDASGQRACTESREAVTDAATLAALQTLFDDIETGIPEITAKRTVNAANKAAKLADEKAKSEAFMSGGGQ